MADRFDELLPFYVNGTLAAEDREWFERHLAEHPEARAELEWTRALQQRVLDSAPAVPETIGLAKAMTLIRGDRPSLAERVSAFFAGFGMRPVPALAALAVIVVQGGAIVGLLESARDDATELRSLRAVADDGRPLLKINFAPDAKEAEIRHLLVSVQGRVTGGPGQLGDWFVAVPAGKEAELAAQLQAHPIVQAVSVAPGLPPRE